MTGNFRQQRGTERGSRRAWSRGDSDEDDLWGDALAEKDRTVGNVGGRRESAELRNSGGLRIQRDDGLERAGEGGFWSRERDSGTASNANERSRVGGGFLK